MPFSSNVTRVISISFVWGTLLVSHLRRRKQDSGGDQLAVPGLEPLTKSLGNQSHQLTMGDCVDASIECASNSTEVSADQQQPILLDGSSSLLRRLLSTIGSFVSPSSEEEHAVVAAADRAFADSLNVTRGIAASLGLPTHLSDSFYAKLPFRRSSSINHLKSFVEELELLNFYGKSNQFLETLAPTPVSSDLVRSAVAKLENVAVSLLGMHYPADELEARVAAAASERTLLLALDAPAVRGGADLTPFPALGASPHRGGVGGGGGGGPKETLARYAFCQFLLASFLASLSILPQALEALSQPCLRPWLEVWSTSQDIRLKLLSTKIQHNLLAQKSLFTGSRDRETGPAVAVPLENEGSPETKRPRFNLSHSPPAPQPLNCTSVSNPPAIYGPDVFKLDQRDESPNAPPPEVDVIFINGMLGSVYHTWRQRDSANTSTDAPAACPNTHPNDRASGVHHEGETNDPLGTPECSHESNSKVAPSFPGQVSCWPRAWLSKEFPNARILGVNANLKPFIWNPICPAEKTKRRIDQRAQDILLQLVMAGVGHRPIIWIAHSAGGILTKEVLKLSATWFPGNMVFATNDKGPESPDGRLLSAVSVDQSLHAAGSAASAAAGPPTTASLDGKASGCGLGSPIASAVNVEELGAVARQTKGIVFLSVPHRGNQSMMFLYYFPMVFTLTPEAKQLQQNNASILELHNWFLKWASARPLEVLNMVEERVTVVNRWYSVHLVQPEPQDEDFSEVVLVDTDHTDICKPRNCEDEVYLRISNFIHRLMNCTS